MCVKRRLSAILAADLVGYSRLMGEDEAGTVRRLMGFRTDFIEPLIAEKRGRVVKLMGDGFLVEFQSAVDAVECGVEWQRGVANGADLASGEDPLQFRIGINLGEVIVEDDDIYGDGVNVAARIEGLAEPSSVCVSDDVYRQVDGKQDVRFEDLGKHNVKNIAKPVHVYRIIDAADGPNASDRNTAPSPTMADKASIAVLPFDNMSKDNEQDYFSDGLTEDIITELSRFHSLFVIARNSTFAYKNKATNLRQVGRELGAHYVVEGSVRKAGNRVRVTAQLIDANTGSHLWAQKYDRDMDDIFAVQDELTRAIVATLPERVSAADLKRVKRKPTEQMVAYDYFLHGRELHHVGTKQATKEGAELLEKALELDPNFAQAWAWLACVLGLAWLRGYLPDTSGVWNKINDSARKALELDEEDSECHRILCETSLIRRKFNEAAYHNDRGLALNPNDPRLVLQRGYLLAYMGAAEEGIEWVEMALKLDPVGPEKYNATLGFVLHDAKRYDDAIAVFKRLSRPRGYCHAYLASAHAHLGQTAAAQDYASKLLKKDADFTIATYAKSLRYRDRETSDHLAQGLRKAGLPEK